MSGEGPCNWSEDDACSHHEGVARSLACGCQAPLVLELRATLILVRCSHCQKIAEHHSVVAEGWA